MLGAMQYHAAHLFDFSGRDARQTFWYWFLFLFIVNIVVGMAMSVPMMVSAMSTALEASRNGDPTAGQAAMINQMSGSMRPLIVGAIVLGLVNIALIAAAFVRRLHDSGRSGMWAALAGGIYLVSLWTTWSHADQAVDAMRQIAATSDPTKAMALQSRLAWQNLLGYVPLIMVIGFGLLKSDPAANRFGEEPVRF